LNLFTIIPHLRMTRKVESISGNPHLVPKKMIPFAAIVAALSLARGVNFTVQGFLVLEGRGIVLYLFQI
jgi:hypothetical protein